MVERRSYPVQMRFSGWEIDWIEIDPLYELRHSAYMTDELILVLVRSLDGSGEIPEAVTQSGFDIFRLEVTYLKKVYRLILTWPKRGSELEQDYIGVINAFRIRSLELVKG